MVKTRSSARVGSRGAAPAGAAENGDANGASARRIAPPQHVLPENGSTYRSTYSAYLARQNQSGAAGGGKEAGAAGAGAGAMPGGLLHAPPGRPLYHHSASAPGGAGYGPPERSAAPALPRTNAQAAAYAHAYQQYHQQAEKSTQHYPVHPDVRLRKLPFYDSLGEIMKPSTLVPVLVQVQVPGQPPRPQEANFFFHLTPSQASDIACGRDIVGINNKMENVTQAQLRFCLLETSCEQDDCFPPGVVVKINNKACPLPNTIPTNKPGVEPKRPPRPVNITSLLKLSPTVSNSISVQWSLDYSKVYAISISLVKKLTSAQLLQRLKNKGTKNSDYTRSIIKEKLSEDYDCEIATTCLRVSLMCPLGKMKMQVPCRPQTCSHLQCFDGSIFLQMNERKPTWSCPVCDKPATYDSLVVDGYFMEVLSSSRLPAGCSDIQLNKDGTWSAQSPKKAAAISPSPSNTTDSNIEIISDDVEVIPLESGSEPAAKRLALASAGVSASADDKPKAANPVVDLTSDSDDDLPLKRKVPDSSSQHQNSHNKYSEGGTVSSSGYKSPAEAGPRSPQAIISLDSPSPPLAASPSPPPAGPPAAARPASPQMAINPLAVNGNKENSTDATLPNPVPAHQSSLPRAVDSVSPMSRQNWAAVAPYTPDPVTDDNTVEVPLSGEVSYGYGP